MSLYKVFRDNMSTTVGRIPDIKIWTSVRKCFILLLNICGQYPTLTPLVAFKKPFDASKCWTSVTLLAYQIYLIPIRSSKLTQQNVVWRCNFNTLFVGNEIFSDIHSLKLCFSWCQKYVLEWLIYNFRTVYIVVLIGIFFYLLPIVQKPPRALAATDPGKFEDIN